MGKVYSKDEIIKMMKEAKSDMKNFYKKEFVIIQEKHQIPKSIIQKLLQNGY